MPITLGYYFNVFGYVFVCCSANSSDDTITTDLTIEIDDVNDETPIISGMSIININEEQPAGTVLSTGIVVDDADAGDTLSYSLRGMSFFTNF